MGPDIAARYTDDQARPQGRPLYQGYIHIQTNPEYVYDTGKTTANGFS